jgi:hypothetical protein
MLGAGTPLFQGGRGGSTLQLVGSRSFDCGAVLVSYRPK